MPASSVWHRRLPQVLLAALAAAAAWLAAKALWDPATPFLPTRAGASWILYPTPPVTLPQSAVEVDTVFRRAFVGQIGFPDDPALVPAVICAASARHAELLVP